MGELVSLAGWRDSHQGRAACRTSESEPSADRAEDQTPVQDSRLDEDLSTVEDAMDVLLAYEPSGHERFPIWYTVLEPQQVMNGGRPASPSAPLGPAG